MTTFPIGSPSPFNAPWYWVSNSRPGNYQISGFANIGIGSGEQTLQALIGSPTINGSPNGSPGNAGFANIENFGTLNGTLTVLGAQSHLSLTGPGGFNGTLTFAPVAASLAASVAAPVAASLAASLAPTNASGGTPGGTSGFIQTYLNAGSLINVDNPASQVEIAGFANPNATIAVNAGHLQLDQLSFLPTLTLTNSESNSETNPNANASVTWQSQFSPNTVAIWQHHTLTIADFGLHHLLTESVSVSTPQDWVLVEGPHSPGQTFNGLTLESTSTLANSLAKALTSSDNVLHPTILA